MVMRNKVMASAALLGACLLTASCGMFSQPVYEMDKGFSFNIVRPTITEKNLKDLTPIERATYDRYGPPDFMRILWNDAGELSLGKEHLISVLSPYHEDRSRPRAWIYLRRGIEISFLGGGSKETPLTDQLRTLCQLGDPERSELRPLSGDNYLVEWVYYKKGRRFKFDAAGHLVNSSVFPSLAPRG